MFTIVISERGGAERRETFEKGEINVGRVQGNDLMLAKGNVSKHHARLIYRDARFIVTDLKSTNGTYVNGRKISQATIVREGDKIYVGDFVLRLESAGRADATGAPASVPTASNVLEGSAAPPADNAADPADISHYPLERDPDSESPPEMQDTPLPRVPAAPRVPQALGETRLRATSDRVATPPHRASSTPHVHAPSAPRESTQAAKRRIALIALVDRVADAVDLAPLGQSAVVDEALAQRIERAVQEQARAMKADGEASDAVDLEVLARDAVRELLGLGPIAALLEDAEVDEIHVLRPDCVLLRRDGEADARPAPSFTSEESLARIVARLAQQSGQPAGPGEILLERRLPGGAHMVAISPPAASGWALTIRKRRRVTSSLDEMVQAGAMSRPMASFLEACVAARANVLVVGFGPGVVPSMIAALAHAFPAGEWVALLQDAHEITVPHAQVVPLTPTGARADDAVRAATRLGADRLVLAPVAGVSCAAVIDAIGEGSEGVIMGMAAPSLRHALGRLSAQVALAHPAASVEAAREAVGEAFDVAVELGRGPGGKVRVTRLAELAGADAKGVVARDLFQGSGDAGPLAAGPTPRLANDFAARGVKLDSALFKRAR